MSKLVTLDLLSTFLDGLKKNFEAPKAKTSERPEGFYGHTDKAEWGSQKGTCITDWYTDTGANIAFRDAGGSVDVVTSGNFYSDDGAHLVLDSGNYKKFLPVGGSTGGTSEKWDISISGTANSAVNDDRGRKISETYVSMAGGAIDGDLHVKGDIYASHVHNAIYNDYAEFFEKGGDAEPGDIIALDTSSDKEQYKRATRDSKVIVGVYSDEYAQIIGGTPSKLINQMSYIPVAIAGRVHVKVTGYVKPGDAIVISDTLPGVGMADDGTGKQVVGVALTEKKDGKVRMLVHRG